MNFSPSTLVANRTARLVAESKTPVYSTSTPAPQAREHITAVEVETGCGRYWRSMPDNEVNHFIDNLAPSYDLSDIDHSARCWCQK